MNRTLGVGGGGYHLLHRGEYRCQLPYFQVSLPSATFPYHGCKHQTFGKDEITFFDVQKKSILFDKGSKGKSDASVFADFVVYSENVC